MRVPGVRPRIRIALGVNRLAAVLPGGRTLETDEVSDVQEVFTDLRTRSGIARARVDIALIPPLVDVRTLKLPPMKGVERQRIIERDARRYFVGVTEPVVIGATASSPAGVIAAAVPCELLSRIEGAVTGAGWSLGVVIPAPFAWCAAAADGDIAIQLEHGVEVLRVAGHRLIERRRQRLAPAGVPVMAEPVVAAARHASVSWAPELVSTARRAHRTRITIRLMHGLFAATAALLALAAGVDYWGLSHRLTRIEARRAALAPAVSRAMATNDTLGTISGGLVELQGLTQSGHHWSAFLTDLAEFLPPDAHLVGLRISGDSLTLVGVAGRSVGVFDALGQMPSVVGLRAVEPIQRDVQADGSVRERFAFGAAIADGEGKR